jgi:hypothetical protein
MNNNEYIDLDALLNKKIINISNNSKGKRGSVKKKHKQQRKSAIKKKKNNIVKTFVEKEQQQQTSIQDMINNVEPNSLINLDINNLEEVDNIFADISEIETENADLSENLLPISNIEDVLDTINTDKDIKEDYDKYNTCLDNENEKYVIINNGIYKDLTGLEKEILFEPSSQKTYIIVELLNDKQHIKVPFDFINYIEEESNIVQVTNDSLLNQYLMIPFLKLYGVSSNLDNVVVKVTRIVNQEAIILPIHPLLNKPITKPIEFLQQFDKTDEPTIETIYSIDSRIFWNTNAEIKKNNYLINNCGDKEINGLYKLWEYPYDSIKMDINGKLLEEINGPFYYNSLKNNIILMKNNKKWYIVDMDLHKLKVVSYYYFNLENNNSYTPPLDNWCSPNTFVGKLPAPIIEKTDINTLRQQTSVSKPKFKSVFDEDTLRILSNN